MNDFSFHKKLYKGKRYFQLTTQRITYLALIFAINIIFIFIGKFVLGLIPIYGFLVIEITFITYLIAWFFINYFYAVILLLICTWIRVLIVDDSYVSVLALIFCDFFVLTFFILCYYFFSTIIKIKNSYIREFVILIISMFITLIFSGFFGIFINWAIMIRLYNFYYGLSFNPNNLILLFTIFGFNMLKYLVNIAAFIVVLTKMIFFVNRL